MYILLSSLAYVFYNIIDIPFLHLLYFSAIDSGYLVDTVKAKGTHNVFRRLKKVSTIFRRQ